MRAVPAFLLLTACTTEGSLGTTQPNQGRVQVALVAAVAPPQQLDLLFVVDDSPGMQPIGESLVASFPAFADALAGLPTGMPDLHLGVVSSDMGVKAVADPWPELQIGYGAGSCTGSGKDGLLTRSDVVTGPFITSSSTGTNYLGTLAEAFGSIASLGYEGCGFEQPLHAAERAFAQPDNAGFLRSTAKLAIIVVGNEDDCSVSRNAFFAPDSSVMGPLASFRCTRFGVTCEHGGRTTDEMNLVGEKRNCHANESLSYLTSVRDHASAFLSLKTDPRDVLFAAIAAEASSLEVNMQTPPGGGAAIPTLKELCPGGGGTTDGEPWSGIVPAVRLTEHAKAFERGRTTTMCGGSVHAPLLDIAREIRGLMGDACLARDIALPADCEAFDTRADGTSTPLRACTQSGTGSCWELVADPGCAGQGRRLHVTRTSAPAADAAVSLRCKL